MTKTLRQSFMAFLSAVLTVASLAGISPVSAAKNKCTVSYVLKVYPSNKLEKKYTAVYDFDGPVYCADMFKDYEPGAKLGSRKNLWSSLTAEKKKALGLISHFGYGFNGDKSNAMYAATQYAIWEYMYYGTLGKQDLGIKTGAAIQSSSIASKSVNVSTVKSKFNALCKKVNALLSHWDGASFAGSTVTVKYGAAQILTDKNSVLKYFTVSSNNAALKASISDNKLSLNMTKASPGTATLTFTLAGSNTVKESGLPVLYNKSGDYQRMFRAGTYVPSSFKLTVNLSGEGTITLTKQDAATSVAKAQGTASLKGAVYGVYSDSSCKTLKTKITIGADGTGKSSALTWGTYYLKEITAPTGYNLSTTVTKVTLSQTSVSQTVKDEVIKGNIHVTKKDASTKDTITQGQATFDIIANAAMMIGTKSYAKGAVIETLTTKNGEATSSALPYGSYTVKETKAPMGYLVNVNTQNVSLTKNDVSVDVTVSDESVKGTITLVKEDAETGSKAQGTASLKDAMYTLYAKEDIVDPISGKTLYKKGAKVTSATCDENGKAVFSNLALGLYELKETTAPTGYLLNSGTIAVPELTNEDANATVLSVSLKAKDTVKKGRIKVIKQDTSGEVVKYKGTVFGIYANADMYIGSKLYKKGQLIESLKTTDGAATSSLLPFGTYVVRETSAPDGYVLGVQDEDVILSDDGETKNVVIKDKRFSVSKVDAAGKEVPEAKLTVTDKDGKIVDQWTSDTSIHYVSGLIEGNTYTLTETAAPDGYVVSQAWTFTVSDKKKDEHHDVVNTRVCVKKTDAAGAEINGAQMDVTDAKGHVVDAWTSQKGQDHYVKNLIQGQTYTLTERTAPEGYVKAGSITFTAGEDQKDTTVVMKDKTFTVSKVNVAGDEVAGAEMEVRDEKGKLVDKWTSDGTSHPITGLTEGSTYTLKETVAPEGYVLAQDWTFTVSADKVNDHHDVVNTRVNVAKNDVEGHGIDGAQLEVTDQNGEVVDSWITKAGETHFVKGLKDGCTYTLRETEVPEGYVKAADLTFKAGEDGKDLALVMTDKRYSVSKKNLGGDEVPGAHIRVEDEEGDLVDEWVSTTEKHFIKNLTEGKTYKMIETQAPKGYVITEAWSFTVSSDKVDEHHDMVDKKVSVTKTDLTTGAELPGAKLMVCDENGNIVDAWTSAKTPHDISSLVEGQTYTLCEDLAPLGYNLASSITFKVKSGENQVIEMKDEPILTTLCVRKTDADTNALIMNKDFEFTLYSDEACKNKVASKSGDTKTGTVTFENLTYGTYWLKETEAPDGYVKSATLHEIVIDDNLDGVGTTATYTVKNSKGSVAGVTETIRKTVRKVQKNVTGVVDTGDGVRLCVSLAVLMLACIMIFVLKKKPARR